MILDRILKEETSKKFSAGCLMLNLENKITNWPSILKMIHPEDIYDDSSHEFGLSVDCHITILFGFDKNVTSADVQKLFENEHTNISFSLTSISTFPGEEYDVVKFDVESEDLKRLHELCKSLPHHLTFPDYKPHMTIAYVKKGTGEKYVKKFKPMEMEGNTLLFSDVKKNKSSWKIKKKYNFIIDLTSK